MVSHEYGPTEKRQALATEKIRKSTSNNRIYTIGHSDHDIDTFLKLLTDKGVGFLEDVRGSPTSWRHPQFNSENLAQSCRKVGIEYRHCGELGNKSVPIARLIETEQGQIALERLASRYENSSNEATAMMCSEKESRGCHTYLISQRLFDDFGINATHIGYHGAVTKHVKLREKPDLIRPALPPKITGLVETSRSQVNEAGPCENSDEKTRAENAAAKALLDEKKEADQLVRETTLSKLLNAKVSKKLGEVLAEPKDSRRMVSDYNKYVHSEIRWLAASAMAMSSTPEEMAIYEENIMSYDKTIPFDRECVENAAMLAGENMTTASEFPGLFQLSYRWIFDSGASRNFCGEKHAKQFAQHLREAKAVKIGTAAGIVTMNQVMDISVPWDAGASRPVHVLPDTPPLVSMGAAVESGFSFYWNSGFYPCLVSGQTKQVFIFDVCGGLPIMAQGGAFEQIRNQQMIETLT